MRPSWRSHFRLMVPGRRRFTSPKKVSVDCSSLVAKITKRTSSTTRSSLAFAIKFSWFWSLNLPLRCLALALALLPWLTALGSQFDMNWTAPGRAASTQSCGRNGGRNCLMCSLCAYGMSSTDSYIATVSGRSSFYCIIYSNTQCISTGWISHSLYSTPNRHNPNNNFNCLQILRSITSALFEQTLAAR